MEKNGIYIIMFLFLFQVIQINNKNLLKTKTASDPIADYEADKDPATNYNQYYFENSLENFANAMFNQRKTPDDMHLCLIDNKFNARNNSRKFLQAYNNLFNSIKYAKEHNKSYKIDSSSECVYSLNQDWNETADKEESHVRSIYVVSKRYFLDFFRSEFFTDFLKYLICIQTNKKYHEFMKVWRVFIYEKTYPELFGNYCTISNIYHFISKKIEEKKVENPFYFLGNLLGTLFDKISPHLMHIAVNHNLDKI